MDLPRNPTRSVRIGSVTIGAGHPIAVQSMTATHTQNMEATVAQVNALGEAGADVVRIAVDSTKDAEALAEIRQQTKANLSVDLQENYRLAAEVAPHVDKVRYNPGHLYHHEREKPWQDKVTFLVDVAGENDCAMRVGVNCGIGRPGQAREVRQGRLDHAHAGKRLGALRIARFARLYALLRVAEGLRSGQGDRGQSPLCRAAARRSACTWASPKPACRPRASSKPAIAFEQLISRGIGDTIRVSLTVPNARKPEEIEAGRKILADIAAGRVRTVVDFGLDTLNIISCPSCSRVENEAFIELAQDVKEMTRYASQHAITIAVMGCRVNGPGETDDADLGLWCGPNFVNLKRGSLELGAYPYDAILPRLKRELDELIAQRTAATQ